MQVLQTKDRLVIQAGLCLTPGRRMICQPAPSEEKEASSGCLCSFSLESSPHKIIMATDMLQLA